MITALRKTIAQFIYPEVFIEAKKNKIINDSGNNLHDAIVPIISPLSELGIKWLQSRKEALQNDDISSFRIIGKYIAPAGNIKELKSNIMKYCNTLKTDMVLPYSDTYLYFLKRYNYTKNDIGIKKFNNYLKIYCAWNKLEYVNGKHRINGKVDSYSIFRSTKA